MSASRLHCFPFPFFSVFLAPKILPVRSSGLISFSFSHPQPTLKCRNTISSAVDFSLLGSSILRNLCWMAQILPFLESVESIWAPTRVTSCFLFPLWRGQKEIHRYYNKNRCFALFIWIFFIKTLPCTRHHARCCRCNIELDTVLFSWKVKGLVWKSEQWPGNYHAGIEVLCWRSMWLAWAMLSLCSNLQWGVVADMPGNSKICLCSLRWVEWGPWSSWPLEDIFCSWIWFFKTSFGWVLVEWDAHSVGKSERFLIFSNLLWSFSDSLWPVFSFCINLNFKRGRDHHKQEGCGDYSSSRNRYVV